MNSRSLRQSPSPREVKPLQIACKSQLLECTNRRLQPTVLLWPCRLAESEGHQLSLKGKAQHFRVASCNSLTHVTVLGESDGVCRCSHGVSMLLFRRMQPWRFITGSCSVSAEFRGFAIGHAVFKKMRTVEDRQGKNNAGKLEAVVQEPLT